MRSSLLLVLLVSCVGYSLVEGAALRKCSIGDFECEDGKACIPFSMRCDNITQCADKSDEYGCSLSKPQAVRLSGQCNSYDREKLNEGYRTCVYKDSMGIPTIGIGFNLKKFGAKSEIESVGADYDKVLDGSQCLTDSQIHQLFDKDMDSAVSCAEGFVGSKWSAIGTTRESAVADMAFNLGCFGLGEFHTLKADLQSGNYQGAVASMRGSLWCRQVGSRCERDVACME